MRLFTTNVQVILSLFFPIILLLASPTRATIKQNYTEDEKQFLGDSETTVTNYEANKNKDLRLIVNKCCRLNQRYDYENGSCVDLEIGSSGNGTELLMTADTLTNMPWWNPEVESTGNFSSQPVDAILFELKTMMPDCAESELIKKIVHKDSMSQCYTPEANSSLNKSSLLLTTSGYLVYRSADLMNALPYSDFCLDQVSDTTFIAMICKNACTAQKPCVRKCCPPEMIFDEKSLKCVPAERPPPWITNFYDESLNKTLINPKSDLNLRYQYGAPECIHGYNGYNMINPNTDKRYDKLKTLVNGSIVVSEAGAESYALLPNSYCTDVLFNNKTIMGGPLALTKNDWNELDQVILMCFYPNQDPTDNKPKWKYTVHGIGALISATFLTLTAIVYLITWTNFHGWLQFAYVVSLLQAFLFLGILQLASTPIEEYSACLCELMGSILHFSFLSAFFWLTSMNFDIWWTFSGYRPLTARSRGGEIRRYLFFALFSWGCASLIAGTGLTLDLLYKFDIDSTIIRPRFGERKCYFSGYEEQLPYLYGPMGVLLVIDLLFFLHTVYSLHKLQQDTRFATQQSSRREKKKFILFVKLFVVMGILWIFELLSWIATVYDNTNKDTWDNVFFIFDVINSGQGLLIFIIFTCKPNTCRQLETQFKKFAVFLEERRDKGIGQSVWIRTKSCIGIAVIMLTLPIVHLFRIMFSYCGRKQMSTVGRQQTQTTTTFDKFRKTSTSSTSTSLSLKDPAAYELGVSGLHI